MMEKQEKRRRWWRKEGRKRERRLKGAVSNRIITFPFANFIQRQQQQQQQPQPSQVKSLNVPSAFAIAYTLPEDGIEI